MAETPVETILEVGSEGGTLTLFGRRNGENEWHFWTGTDETAAVDALNEEDRLHVEPTSRTAALIASFETGITLLDNYQWFRMTPLKVAAEFQDAVLLEVKKRATQEEAARWQETLMQNTQPDSVHQGEQVEMVEMEVITQKQVSGIREGSIVEAINCPQWGPGKIVHIGNCLHIVFRDGPGKTARTFPVDTNRLVKSSIQNDPRLDNLPPLVEKDGSFHFRVEPLSLEEAMKTFLRHFPEAFADPGYSKERVGKDLAHQQFQEQLDSESLKALLESDDIPTLIKRALAVKTPVAEMLSRFENAALADALQEIGPSRTFFEALLQLLEAPVIDKAVFDPYIQAVASLPVKKGKAATWPIATLFPHIAQPDRHMFLKPEAARAAAERLGFNLKYETGLNWETYSALLRMGETYLALLKSSGAKDFFDVQSFFFVANGGYDK